MDVKVKYFTDDLIKLEKIQKGDWTDLRASEDMEILPNEFVLVPLGVGMKLPDGYEAHVAPRSSTFKKWGIIQTNSVGIIDNSYSGDNDQWMMPVYATRYTKIKKNDRVCQFRIMETMPELTITEVENLDEVSRGGFGSTGHN